MINVLDFPPFMSVLSGPATRQTEISSEAADWPNTKD